jgi:hypothetical protein
MRGAKIAADVCFCAAEDMNADMGSGEGHCMRRAGRLWHTGRCGYRQVWPWGVRATLLWLLVLAGTAAAQWWQTDVHVVETLSRGQVDWTAGAVLNRASATGTTLRGAGALTEQAAVQAARQGLWEELAQVRLDARQLLGLAILHTEAQRQALEAFIAQAAVVETRYLPRGIVETAVQLPFAGQLTALLLSPSSTVIPEAEPGTEAAHTGVVIDARGLAIQPALLPRIVDEGGQPLYAPEVVNVEAAVQQGYIAYAKAFDQAPAQARIGERPLVLRALRVAGDTRVDLVLSHAEATRIRDYAATRHLVRQCRILIVM